MYPPGQLASVTHPEKKDRFNIHLWHQQFKHELERSTWFTFPALTVEAGGVRGVFNVTYVGDSLVAECIVSACCDLHTLVSLAIIAIFAVGIVYTS